MFVFDYMIRLYNQDVFDFMDFHKKSRNQRSWSRKSTESWPPITNGVATTLHSAMALKRVANMRPNLRADEAQRGDFFNLGREICSHCESNPGPRMSTWCFFPYMNM
jgi:hypothetical protein